MSNKNMSLKNTDWTDLFGSSKKNCRISLSYIILNWCLVTGNGAFDSCILTHHNRLHLQCLIEFGNMSLVIYYLCNCNE